MTEPVENPVMKSLLLHLIHWSHLWGKVLFAPNKEAGRCFTHHLSQRKTGSVLQAGCRRGLLLLDGLTVLAGVQMNLANSLITTSNICRLRNRLTLTPCEAISLSSACKEDIV